MSPETQSDTHDLTPGFGGLRVVAFESRMAAEVATMIERRGGVAIVAPAMREVPLEDNHAALDFAERLLAGEFDAVIFMTGVGTRALFADGDAASTCRTHLCAHGCHDGSARAETDSCDARARVRAVRRRAGTQYLARSAERSRGAGRAQGQARRSPGIWRLQSRTD